MNQIELKQLLTELHHLTGKKVAKVVDISSVQKGSLENLAERIYSALAIGIAILSCIGKLKNMHLTQKAKFYFAQCQNHLFLKQTMMKK